jgi:spermidine synthase
MKPRLAALYLCFFLSGASALIYQVVWERMLTLVFGVSTFSVAAVLSAFLGGMALGARIVGPLADRTPRPLRFYALIELGIALTALATLGFIPPLMRAFATLYPALAPGWFGSNLIRFALALLAIGLPCLLIGATVPAMARLLTQWTGSTAVGFGRGYTINTAGSVLGTLAAGFVLIRLVGTQHTLLCAVAGNTVAALLAAALNLRGAPLAHPTASRAITAAPAADSADTAPTLPRLALVLATLTGGIALAYEVAWVRLLAIFTLNSVYVFAMVVSVYLAALAIGAAVVTRALRRHRVDELATLAVVQLAQALLVPVLVAVAPRASRLQLTSGTLSEPAIFWTEYALVAAVVFIPTLLIGAGLPLLVSLTTRSAADPGRTVGRLYAWNALGTIAGAALTGGFLIPWIGLRGCLLLLAGANFALVAIATYAHRPGAAWYRALVPAGAAAFALLLALLPAAPRFYVPTDVPGETVLYYAEGPSATVHVAEYTERERRHRTLFVDSKSVAGTYDEIVTDQKMLAHLPLLLHPSPQRALTVGFGTGGTSYSMLQHKLAVDCVEIEPRVADAYYLFESQNCGVVGPNHERLDFHLILDDARAWLHVAPQTYDVIVTDLTSIQYRGNGNLYTAECFELLRSRLSPGGIGAAWVPITGITSEALHVLVRTFREVFPHTSVWYMLNLPTDFVVLVGTPAPVHVNLADFARRMAAPLVQRDLAPIGLDDPAKLAACLLLAEQDVARYAGPGPTHHDDRPLLDYLAHAAPYHNTLPANLTELAQYRSDLTAYVTLGPADQPATTTQPVVSAAHWAAWRAASDYLIAGHAAFRDVGAAQLAAARAAYTAAADLVPDDARTRQLIADISRASPRTSRQVSPPPVSP